MLFLNPPVKLLPVDDCWWLVDLLPRLFNPVTVAVETWRLLISVKSKAEVFFEIWFNGFFDKMIKISVGDAQPVKNKFVKKETWSRLRRYFNELSKLLKKKKRFDARINFFHTQWKSDFQLRCLCKKINLATVPFDQTMFYDGGKITLSWAKIIWSFTLNWL